MWRMYESYRNKLWMEYNALKHDGMSLGKGPLKGIEVKIIMSENDPANLRLSEAFYIRKCKHSNPGGM